MNTDRRELRVTVERAFSSPARTTWEALSDPETSSQALLRCEAVEAFDGSGQPPDPTMNEGDSYSGSLQFGVDDYRPQFDATLTVERVAYPRLTTSATGEAGDSAFDVQTSITVNDTLDGSLAAWHADVAVEGRLARLGDRALTPAVRRVGRQFLAYVDS